MRKHPSDRPSERDAFHDFPLADADLCVKCALCLPHCPTYKLSRHEGDSPRGRIALMQGLAGGILEPAGKTLPHLDGCLVCRACEPVCPAEVPYGRLIDAGREGLWRSGHRPGAMWRLLAFWRRTPGRLAWLADFIRFVHRSRLAKLVQHLPLGRLSRNAGFIKTAGAAPRPGIHLPEAREHVSLFLGCLARSLDADVLHATVRVLNAMKFAVNIPAAQGCCGAMDAHAGDRNTLRLLAARNLAAFSGDENPVITTASGCGIQLRDYREINDDESAAETDSFSARIIDVMHFIAMHADRLPHLAVQSMRVVVHAPCTLKNGMRRSGDALEVLRGIPGLVVEPLRHADCCGAAGTYLFEQVESADRLGEKLLDALGENIPDVFLTGNIGCALHVRRLAAERGLAMKVLHPVQLLAEALADSGQPSTRL